MQIHYFLFHWFTKMRKLNYGESKPIQIMLTLSYRLITYPYGVIEYVLIRVNDLLVLAYFMILDKPGDFDISLLFTKPFLETSKAFIYIKLGELILRNNK